VTIADGSHVVYDAVVDSVISAPIIAIHITVNLLVLHLRSIVMPIPNSILTLIAGVLLAAVSYWYGQNNGLMPLSASEEATHIDALFNAMMVIATGLFLLVEGVLIVAAIKYRRSPGDNSDGPAIEGNVPLEILWTAIPAAIVLWISVYSFEIYGEMGGFDPAAANDMHAMHGGKHSAMAAPRGDAPPQLALGIGASPASEGTAAAVNVNVTGLQYAWIFNYPDSNITSGELHVPIGQEVKLELKAQDVIHALWIPQLRLKQDTIPGEITQLRFTANKTGTFPVRCAELCGSYHGSMVTTMVVQSPEEYQAWIASQTQPTETAQATFDFEGAIALNPLTMPTRDYLAPYAQEMGVRPELLAQLVQRQQPHQPNPSN
jgi:cytochrome c oxidase subunit II